MKSESIDFGNEGKNFLGAALMKLATADKGNVEALAYYRWLYEKSRVASCYTMAELALLSALTDQSLQALENVLNRTTDLEARIRAQAIGSAFKTIKGKLEDGKTYLREQQSSDEGQDEGRGAGHDGPLPGSGGCAATSPGDSDESKQP